MENIDVCFSYTPLSTCGSWRRTLNEDMEFSMGVGKLESPTVLSVEQDRMHNAEFPEIGEWLVKFRRD